MKKALLTAAVVALGFSMAHADVTGKVTLDGKAPERKKLNLAADAKCAVMHKEPLLDESLVVGKDNGLRDVVIFISNAPKGGGVPADAIVLDQNSCRFAPHVMAAMVGQKIMVKNSDPFLHNVHGLPENNTGFNFGMPNVDPGRPIPNTPFKKPEDEGFLIKCDVHPWMSAHMYVFEHPYFAVSAEDGTFAIKGLKDGQYDIIARHTKLGDQEGKVTVKDGKAAVDFKFKPEDAAMAPVKQQKVLVLSEEKKSCCDESK